MALFYNFKAINDSSISKWRQSNLFFKSFHYMQDYFITSFHMVLIQCQVWLYVFCVKSVIQRCRTITKLSWRQKKRKLRIYSKKKMKTMLFLNFRFLCLLFWLQAIQSTLGQGVKCKSDAECRPPSGNCCSKYGFCGSGKEFCDAGMKQSLIQHFRKYIYRCEILEWIIESYKMFLQKILFNCEVQDIFS